VPDRPRTVSGETIPANVAVAVAASVAVAAVVPNVDGIPTRPSRLVLSALDNMQFPAPRRFQLQRLYRPKHISW